MKQHKEYRGLCWKNEQWTISIDLRRWAVGFWWTEYQYGIALGPCELKFCVRVERV